MSDICIISNIGRKRFFSPNMQCLDFALSVQNDFGQTLLICGMPLMGH